MQPFGPAVLRLVVGVIFFAHGAQKLLGIWGGGGIDGTAAFFSQVGLGPAVPLAIMVGAIELAGGILLVLGDFTLPVTLALTVNIVVAIWKVHLAQGFFLNWAAAPAAGHGYEFNLALLAALVSLMLTGPGALSLDAQRARSAEAAAAGRARIRAGSV